jgi:hypothetical protein
MDYSQLDWSLNGLPWYKDARDIDTSQLDWSLNGLPWCSLTNVTVDLGHIKAVNQVNWSKVKKFNGVSQSNIKTIINVEG